MSYDEVERTRLPDKLVTANSESSSLKLLLALVSRQPGTAVPVARDSKFWNQLAAGDGVDGGSGVGGGGGAIPSNRFSFE